MSLRVSDDVAIICSLAWKAEINGILINKIKCAKRNYFQLGASRIFNPLMPCNEWAREE